MTTHYRIICLIGLAVLATFASSLSQAKEAQKDQQQPHQASITSKILPQTRSRTARSLSDMFEKVKSKIFGSKKQSAAASGSIAVAPIQGSASAVAPNIQKQPWGDQLQYGSYFPLGSGNYQWPNAASNQQVGGFNGQAVSSGPQQGSGYQNSLSNSALYSAGSAVYPGFDSAQVNGPQLSTSVKSNSAPSPSGGGLFSSASHLFAQYLSPNAGSQQQQVSVGQASPIQPQQQTQSSQNGANSGLTNLQQNQYNEFATILDQMVAQTGANSPVRQSNANQPFQGASDISAGQQFGASFGANAGQSGVADTEMSGSSNVQSYLPSANGAAPPQASQKSSNGANQMMGLAEQLAPGAQFNKLISFPFSLTNNDDPSKEGRFKLHIPFLNQHVKRSDQAAAKAAAASQAQQQQQLQQQHQQYLNQQYFNQQQYLASVQNPAQQGAQAMPNLVAQPSQLVPVIASTSQASGSNSGSAHSSVQSLAQSSPSLSAGADSSVQQSPPSGPSSHALPSLSSSISSSVSISSSNPSVSSSIVQQSGNNRPAWSVADVHSGQPALSPSISSSSASSSSSSSSSKMTPIQTSA